jgi:hypothetical protein
MMIVVLRITLGCYGFFVIVSMMSTLATDAYSLVS